MKSMTIPVQNALEKRRQVLHELIDEQRKNMLSPQSGDVSEAMISRLTALALEAGALDQVCAEHDVTGQTQARGGWIR